MNDSSSFIVPNWSGYNRIWKIVAIVLALLCVLLWLLGFGPEGDHCNNAMIIADAGKCEASVDTGAGNSAPAVGAAATAAAGAVAADIGSRGNVVGTATASADLLPDPPSTPTAVVEAALDDGVSDINRPAYALDSSVAAARLYFDSASFTLPPDASIALSEVLDALAARSDTVAVISGFHDPSGSLSYNQQLSGNRASAVHQLMVGLGINKARLLMEKPMQTTGSGTKAEARRVEVSVATLNE